MAIRESLVRIVDRIRYGKPLSREGALAFDAAQRERRAMRGSSPTDRFQRQVNNNIGGPNNL